MKGPKVGLGPVSRSLDREVEVVSGHKCGHGLIGGPHP